MSGAVQVTEGFAAKLIKNRNDARGAKPMPRAPETPAADSVVPTEPGRDLADVERDIADIHKAERRNYFKMGALLIEAKAKVPHGDWLPWLAKHFDQSNSTAENYMLAARYHAKFPTVGNLKLRADAIYWLANSGGGGAKLDKDGHERYGVKWSDARETVEAYIFERAKTQWLRAADCDAAFTRFARKATLREKGRLGIPSEAEMLARRPPKPPSTHPAAIAAAAERAARPPVPVRMEPLTEAEIRALADRALGIGVTGNDGQAVKRAARQEFKTLLSPKQTKQFEDTLQLHGILAGAVKGLCNIAPNIAHLIHSRVETDKLVEASAVLQAIVAAREAIAIESGTDPEIEALM